MIEYQMNSRYSIYFQPLNLGNANYYVEIHDFEDLSCWKDRVSYSELSEILKGNHHSII